MKGLCQGHGFNANPFVVCPQCDRPTAHGIKTRGLAALYASIVNSNLEVDSESISTWIRLTDSETHSVDSVYMDEAVSRTMDIIKLQGTVGIVICNARIQELASIAGYTESEKTRVVESILVELGLLKSQLSVAAQSALMSFGIEAAN